MTTHDDTKNPSLPPSAPLTPSTPHELHAGGLMTAARVASLVGFEAKTVANRMSDGRLPSIRVGGVGRVEPLVAWAMRQGVSTPKLRQVAAFLVKHGASATVVDDCIKFIASLIEPDPSSGGANVVAITEGRRGRKAKSLEGPPVPPGAA